MTEKLTFEMLLAACRPGGASALSCKTELRPAAGEFAGVAPARYVRGAAATYAFEKRFLEAAGGEKTAQDVVILDSKGSSLNRVEEAVAQAVRDGLNPLSQTPRIVVTYGDERYMDMELPHRATDAHIRAGSIDGHPVTQDERYRSMRDANPANMRALLEMSGISGVLGVWDSTRKSHQLRVRSALVGETIGVLADQVTGRDVDARGGARVDPVAASVKVTGEVMAGLLADQKDELSSNNVAKIEKEVKSAKKGTTSAAGLGFGAIPPSLDGLGLVSCSRIIRSHVLSFSALRQLRFGLGADGDAAARALLAALALCGLIRSYAEVTYRANCDLVEAAAPEMKLDARYGNTIDLALPEPEEADALLEEAIAVARAVGIDWAGQEFVVTGNPAIVANREAEAEDDN